MTNLEAFLIVNVPMWIASLTMILIMYHDEIKDEIKRGLRIK